MTEQPSILVTGAGGGVGSVGFKIVQLLREKDIAVRAMVHRIDERSDALVSIGAEIVQGDLTKLSDIHRAVQGCKRIYFSMSVSETYLEAALTTAAVAKHHGVDVFVNMSQLTVSQMNIFETTESKQQKYHWLVEQALNWSGLPVVHLRPTVFLENPFFSQFAANTIASSNEIRLPFGKGKTSPIASMDVARVAAEILANPKTHIGKVYEMTGPKSQDMNAMAEEFSKALGRDIRYVDVPYDSWAHSQLQSGLPVHLKNHIATMAKLHHDNRYDRLSDSVQQVTGAKPTTVEQWVKSNSAMFERQKEAM